MCLLPEKQVEFKVRLQVAVFTLLVRMYAALIRDQNICMWPNGPLMNASTVFGLRSVFISCLLHTVTEVHLSKTCIGILPRFLQLS